jgi:hypothetical protein
MQIGFCPRCVSSLAGMTRRKNERRDEQFRLPLDFSPMR